MNTFRRKQLAHGVFTRLNAPTIVFVTTCTKDRQPWLCDPSVHAVLEELWMDCSTWYVGRYVIMPDHIHLFASPVAEKSLERWMKYWKAQASRKLNRRDAWQPSHWDTRIRNQSLYEEKWEYVRENPVRKGLVNTCSDWPYQGELHDLQW